MLPQGEEDSHQDLPGEARAGPLRDEAAEGRHGAPTPTGVGQSHAHQVAENITRTTKDIKISSLSKDIRNLNHIEVQLATTKKLKLHLLN